MSSRFEQVEDVLAAVQRHFRPAQAGGVEVVGLLNLTGEGGGQWVLRIHDGRLTITPGTTDDPQAMQLTASVADFLALANGELDAMKAYFTGKVRFKGSLRDAYRLMDLFRF